MANNFNFPHILNQARLLMVANSDMQVGGSLGMKSVDEGDYRWFTIVEDLTTLLPMVLIYPAAPVGLEEMDLDVVTYRIDYFFKCLLVTEFSAVQDVLQQKLADTGLMADVFATSPTLFTNPSATIRVLWNRITEIDYSPPEEAELSNNFTERIWASTVTVQVSTNTERV